MTIVLTGASGQLGAYLIDRLLAAGHDVDAWSGMQSGTRGGLTLKPIDLADHSVLEKAIEDADPAAVLHAAAVSSAAAAFDDPTRAERINVGATRMLSDWCRRRRRRLLFTSTDLVFDGSRAWNREVDPVQPLMVYGQTKRAAEPAVLDVPGGLVARLSLMFGPSGTGLGGFFDQAVTDLRAGRPRTFFEDEFRTPIHYRTAAEILTRLLESSDRTGLVHVGGPERMSRFALMCRCASALGIDPRLVRSNRRADAPGPEPRPADASLDTSRLASWLPDLTRPTPEVALLL